MAQAWIRLGSYGASSTSEQAIGSAVPSNHTYEVRVWIANRTGSSKTIRVRHAFLDAGADNSHYRAYDAVIPATDIVVLPIFTMIATDKLYTTQSADGLTVIADALDIS